MKNFILIFLLLSFADLQAQNTPLPDVSYNLGNFTQQLTVRYAPAAVSSNIIIEKLAEGNGKNPGSINYTLNFVQDVRLNYNGTGKELITTSGEITATGDVLYKGYSVAHALVPSRISFTLTVYSGNRLIRSFDFTTTVKNAVPETVIKAYSDSASKSLRAQITGLRCEYNNAAVNNFLSEIRKINEYYGAGAMLVQAKQLIVTANPANFEYLDREHKKLVDARAIINSIDACDYESVLNLSSFDPVQLQSQLSLTGSMLADKERDFDFAYAHLYESYFELGLGLVYSNNYNAAESAFERSLELNPVFAPALLQLAKLRYRTGDLKTAVTMMSDLFFKMNPDPETRQAAVNLSRDMYEAYLDKATASVNKNDFRKAEDHLDNAQYICEKFSGVTCSPELYKLLGTVHNGIYNEIMSDAEELYFKNRFSEAQNRLDDAGDYRIKHKNDIPGEGRETALLKKLRYKDYSARIDNAKREYASGNHQKALEEIDAAAELQKKFDLVPVSDFLQLQADIAKANINFYIKKGNDDVAANRLNAARAALDKASLIAGEYQLENDRTIKDKMEKLRKNIFSTQCINAQNEFDSHLQNATGFVSVRDYRKAGAAFTKADSVYAANSDCRLSTGTFFEQRSEVLPAITYLKILDSSIDEMRRMRYESAYRNYEEAEKYYGQFDIGKYQITHKPLADFIRQDATTGMMVYAADHYRAVNQYDNSLDVYKILMLRKYSYKSLKGSLYQLGQAIGSREKAQSGNSEWHARALSFVPDSKEWKSFYKGFKKGFKG